MGLRVCTLRLGDGYSLWDCRSCSGIRFVSFDESIRDSPMVNTIEAIELYVGAAAFTVES